MVRLCAHVHGEHDAAKSIVEQIHFNSYDKVNTDCLSVVVEHRCSCHCG